MSNPMSTAKRPAATSAESPAALSAARGPIPGGAIPGEAVLGETIPGQFAEGATPAGGPFALADLVDPETFAAVADALGAEAMDRLLGTLVEELEARFGGEDGLPEREALAYDAHAMVSAGGMLGFAGLAALCQEIEAACHAGRDYAPALARLRALRRRVIGAIARMRDGR